VVDYAPAVKKTLREAGCELVRHGRGDIWWNPQTGQHFTVDSKIKSRHTANAIMKQAGLPKRFR
jgi:hypothetical protein